MSCYEDPAVVMARDLLRELESSGLTLSAAESCTGGRLCAAVTSVPGSSASFLGGVVAYSNQAKVRMLEVPEDVIALHGAVSRECALKMAEGCARVFGASVGVSITGVAGPSGGSPEKPVGTVWFGFKLPWGLAAEMRLFPGSREEVQRSSVAFALCRLLEELRGAKGVAAGAEGAIP
ncbi:competence/damage-inducible protein CinA-like protein [Thermanaerovibrio velox DSM 12556]|uniref:Competence/damage-inducible protein CinA-like protein n=1 Tax=Thermanaerovibrio velox DSM 12556 TaxID=926567 RepID=H0UNE4_9BACT|nr:CinA family protein [Thermanaerovibrio velox]EHM09351.1 competence/damage-inducible protein CinA-like protein [Thermanaerovibrio velox DSM 12556]